MSSASELLEIIARERAQVDDILRDLKYQENAIDSALTRSHEPARRARSPPRGSYLDGIPTVAEVTREAEAKEAQTRRQRTEAAAAAAAAAASTPRDRTPPRRPADEQRRSPPRTAPVVRTAPRTPRTARQSTAAPPMTERKAIISERSAKLAANAPSVRDRVTTGVRVLAYRNGDNKVGVPVATSDLTVLLEEATRKLKLPRNAKTVFDERGRVITDLTTVGRDQPVYISQGEPFKDPFDSNPTPWDRLPEAQLPRRLQSTGAVRVRVLRNGHAAEVRPGERGGVMVPAGTSGNLQDLQEFFARCTERLNLPAPAQRIFDARGRELTSTADLRRHELLFVSLGEPFHNPDSVLPWREDAVRDLDDEARLVGAGSTRVRARKNNGDPDSATVFILIPPTPVSGQKQLLERILDEVTEKLNLPSRAKKLYRESGEEVAFPSDLDKEEIVVASLGEPLREVGAVAGPGAHLGRATTPMAVRPQLFGRSGEAGVQGLRIRVRVNGSLSEDTIAIVVPPCENSQQSFAALLEVATQRLGLARAARRIFRPDGQEVVMHGFPTIDRDEIFEVSVGEAFRQRGAPPQSTPVREPRLPASLLANTAQAVRLKANVNGARVPTDVQIVGANMKDLLERATDMLRLPFHARVLYSEEGAPLYNFNDLETGMRVYVSTGEPFRAPGERVRPPPVTPGRPQTAPHGHRARSSAAPTAEPTETEEDDGARFSMARESRVRPSTAKARPAFNATPRRTGAGQAPAQGSAARPTTARAPAPAAAAAAAPASMDRPRTAGPASAQQRVEKRAPPPATARDDTQSYSDDDDAVERNPAPAILQRIVVGGGRGAGERANGGQEVAHSASSPARGGNDSFGPPLYSFNNKPAAQQSPVRSGFGRFTDESILTATDVEEDIRPAADFTPSPTRGLVVAPLDVSRSPSRSPQQRTPQAQQPVGASRDESVPRTPSTLPRPSSAHAPEPRPYSVSSPGGDLQICVFVRRNGDTSGQEVACTTPLLTEWASISTRFRAVVALINEAAPLLGMDAHNDLGQTEIFRPDGTVVSGSASPLRENEVLVLVARGDSFVPPVGEWCVCGRFGCLCDGAE